jgi:hypothetical protein
MRAVPGMSGSHSLFQHLVGQLAGKPNQRSILHTLIVAKAKLSISFTANIDSGTTVGTFGHDLGCP